LPRARCFVRRIGTHRMLRELSLDLMLDGVL
jgi:hypothetical protein